MDVAPATCGRRLSPFSYSSSQATLRLSPSPVISLSHSSLQGGGRDEGGGRAGDFAASSFFSSSFPVGGNERECIATRYGDGGPTSVASEGSKFHQ